MDTITWIEIVVQICRLRIQREMERRMTPKVRGLPGALGKLRHALEADSERLAQRIEDAHARRKVVFDAANGSVESAERDLRDVEEFLSDMEKSNGGPLDDSAPRSSEVASK